jgi:hypothetical protein
VSFKRYQWWTAYQFPFFNGGLHTPFAPEHAFLGADGHLHLRAAADVNLGGGVVWSGAEAVLMFHDDGSEANLGHGNYLVTARLVGGTWNALDPNMAFGVFTYERPATGPTPNTAREIDLAEISRWGWNHKTPVDCPFNGVSGDPKNQFPNAVLCRGSAQFALQAIGQGDKNQAPLMVDRYDIGDDHEVTLVMRWHQGKMVTFEKYKGAHSFGDLPSAPDYAWPMDYPDTRAPAPSDFKTIVPGTVENIKPPPTGKSLLGEEFIPAHTSTSCERFHINFWFGNYTAGMNPNPPPSGPQEVIITNFEFRP